MRRPSHRLFGSLAAALLWLTCAPRAHAADQRFALSVLHFNIQYVAGGLTGFFLTPNPAIDLNAEQVEDSIVRESFEPVLDLFLAHPTWGANIELQGYMLDVMAARHPDVLDKLRALATSGQIEIISFHYSDQLFLAYPREDWVRSERLDRAAFDAHGLPRSTTVFCQEGQAGPGMAGAMADAGYEALVFPKNLFSYQHGDTMPPAPLYQLGNISMITSQGVSYSDAQNSVTTTFWFVDDGELLATGDLDPYLPEQFKKDQAAIAATEAQLTMLEANGYQITTVSKYLTAIAGIVPPATPPPLLDGTWQPDSTDGISRWMGNFGLWWKDERDNDVRALGAMAHRELLAAETAAAQAGLSVQEEIDAGFRLLALGQVTDATGINPFRGEVEYGIAHLTEALRIARDVIERSKQALFATSLAIDTASGLVDKDPAAPPALVSIAEVLPIVIDSGDRRTSVVWGKHAEGHSRVTIRFEAGEDRILSVTFPGTTGDILYTPGLATAPVHVPRGGFVFDHFELALSDGLIGLGGDRFVIKDQARVHIAATITPGSGDVTFHDSTAPMGEEVVWVFHVVDGTEAEAAAVANRVNVTPKVWR